MRFYVFLIFALMCPLFFSCIPKYHKITPTHSVAPTSIEVNDVKITCSVQPFGKKNRFYKKAKKDKLICFAFRMENNSADTMIVDLSSFKLISKEATTLPLIPDAAHTVLEYKRGGYLLLGLFVFPLKKTVCEGEFCKTDGHYFLPIGLPIGLTIYSKIGKTNKEMHQDFTEKGLANLKVAPNSSEERLLFFPGVYPTEWALEFNLDSVEKKKVLVNLPFNADLNEAIKWSN